MNPQTVAPTPNTDDLLRAAAWLEDQADEADAVASVFTGKRDTTVEGARTRDTAAWLRRQTEPGQ